MSDPGTRTTTFALLAVAVASLFCIWWPGYPTGTDMPTHLMTADLLAHPGRLDPWLQPHYPPTSQLSVWLSVPLVLALPLPLAGLLSLTLFAAIAAACAAWLARAVGSDPRWGAIIALSQFFGFGYAMGFTNFLLGNALGMALLAAAIVAAQSPSRRNLLIVCGAAMICAHAHIIAFGMFAAQWILLVAVCVVWRRGASLGPWRWSPVNAIKTSVAFVPAGLVTLLVLAGIREPLAADFDQEMVQGVRLTVDQLALGLVDFGPGGWSLASWALVPAWFGALMAGVVVAQDRRRQVLVAGTIIVWLVLYWTVPFHLGGWAFASPRVLPLLWSLPLLLLPTPRSTYVVAASAIAGVIALVGTGIAQRPAAQTLRQVVAQMSADAQPGRTVVVREPLPSGARSEWIEPFHHAPSYSVAAGGMMQHMMRWNPWMHSVTVVHDGTDWLAIPPEFIHRSLQCAAGPTCDEAYDRLADRTAMQALAFDSVLTPSLDHRLSDRLAARGFVRIATDFLRPAGHLVDVSFVDPPADAAALSLSWPRTLGPLGGVAVSTELLQRGIRLGPIPAGPVTITLVDAAGTVLLEESIDVDPLTPVTPFSR
jgi:MFS family permease